MNTVDLQRVKVEFIVSEQESENILDKLVKEMMFENISLNA